MCHVTPMPTATVTYPPPAISPTLHSRLVCKDRAKKTEKYQNPLLFKTFISSKFIDQKSPALSIWIANAGNIQHTDRQGHIQ